MDNRLKKRMAAVFAASSFGVLMIVALVGATTKGFFTPKELGAASIVAALILILALVQFIGGEHKDETEKGKSHGK